MCRGARSFPGLIDSHLHAIRAALSFSTEVNWIGARSIEEALGRIRKAAQTMPRGAWLIVAGGWNEQQFAERRRPTQAELEAAAPENPVYVQLGYGWAVLTDDGLRALKLAGDADVPNGGRLERDAERQAHRRGHRTAGGHHRALRSAAAADLRAAGGGDARVLPGTEPAGADRRDGPWRQQPHAGRLRGRAGGVAARRDDRAGGVLAERPDVGPRARRLQGAAVARADAVRRRDAALRRPRRAADRRDEQQPAAERRRQGEVLRDCPLGGAARLRAHDALGAGRDRRPPAGDLRAREQGDSDRAAALVDRAPQRRVGEDARADEGARRRLDGAGRDVLRRRGVREAGGSGRRATRTARRHRRSDRRARSVAAPMRTGWPRTTRSRRCSGSSTARR